MRTLLCAAALFSIALLGAGCKHGPSLVGKWTATANGGAVDFDFKDDKTFSMGVKAGAMGMTATGDYKLEGENLSLTTKDFQMPGLPPALLEQAKKSPQFGKPQEVKVKFVSDDEVSMSGMPAAGMPASGNQSLTLKRAK